MMKQWTYETKELSYKGFKAILGYEYGKAYVSLYDESTGLAVMFSPESLRDFLTKLHKARWVLSMGKQS